MKQLTIYLFTILALSFGIAMCAPHKYAMLCTGAYVNKYFQPKPDTITTAPAYIDHSKQDTLTDGLCGDTIRRIDLLLSKVELHCMPTITTKRPATIIVNGLPYDIDLSNIPPLSIDTIYSLTKEQLEGGVILINTKKRKHGLD